MTLKQLLEKTDNCLLYYINAENRVLQIDKAIYEACSYKQVEIVKIKPYMNVNQSLKGDEYTFKGYVAIYVKFIEETEN